jgi:hypothetical protein
VSRIAVLYEDQLQPGTEPRDFGPHQLLVSCLHDEGLADKTTLFQGRPQILQRLHPFVVKGNGNLKRSCQAPDRALQSFAQRVAVFDSDRLRQLLGAAYPSPPLHPRHPKNARRAAVARRRTRGCSPRGAAR